MKHTTRATTIPIKTGISLSSLGRDLINSTKHEATNIKAKISTPKIPIEIQKPIRAHFAESFIFPKNQINKTGNTINRTKNKPFNMFSDIFITSLSNF